MTFCCTFILIHKTAKRLDQIETLILLSRLVWMQGNFANMVDTFSTNIVPRREEDRLES